MELIGLVLLFIVVQVFKAVSKAQKQQTPPPRRTSAQPSRRPFGDVVSQMMEQIGLEDGSDSMHAEGLFEIGDGHVGEETFARDGHLGEGFSRRDELGCVGGTLVHDEHEGEEFPGHVHANARPLAVAEPIIAAEPVSAQKQPPMRAWFTGSQVRYAMIASEVLGRPVSMRKGGLYR